MLINPPRTAFTVGAINLGAHVISYGPRDLQIVTGETMQDTAFVLSNFLDALVIRTNEGTEEMRAMAVQNKMAIINAREQEKGEIINAFLRRARGTELTTNTNGSFDINR